MFKWFKGKKSIKLILISFIASMTLYSVLLFVTIPKIVNSINGLIIFDLSPMGYSVEQAYKILNTMPAEIVDLCRYVQISIDMIYPLSLALFFMFSFAYLSRRINVYSIFLTLPLFPLIFDYLENIFVFILLGGVRSELLIKLASICTVKKSVSTTTIMLSGLFIIFIAFLIKRRSISAQSI